MTPTVEIKELEEKLIAELEENLTGKDLIWRQKSRELWLKEGDRNTKFFHLSTVVRRSSNRIAAIKDNNGDWVQDYQGMGNYFLKNFQELFNTSHPDIPDDMEELINQVISQEENESLTRIPDDQEILTALNSIPNLKAPGPDGIPSLFYKHYGETVKPFLLSAVKSFFHSNHILKEWNNTFICLIPKRQGAATFKDFRPISLCNVNYKVISKIIANRLKPLLHKIISPNQTAFIEGRWINENGLLAQEILHTMRNTKARRGWIGMKIDFMKAFDKLEWNFIVKILQQLGFHPTFISWIYQCVSTSTFSILLNGSPHGHFSPSRRLRQGDPISPYLFVISMEILSRLLYRAETNGEIKGIQISRGGPQITHLMFADDLLILTKATEANIRTTKSILDKFCAWSGQE
ncbi:hypothetical protein CRG98_048402, partial [Punica granatum]